MSCDWACIFLFFGGVRLLALEGFAEGLVSTDGGVVAVSLVATIAERFVQRVAGRWRFRGGTCTTAGRLLVEPLALQVELLLTVGI
ncbi:hypothetical protein D9M69_571820 [compost metagenome]